MKRLFLILVFCTTIISVQAASLDIDCIKYKPLKDKSKISYDESTGKWSEKINKKKLYYIKTKTADGCYEYRTNDKNNAFTMDSSYEFINDGALIGYSNKDLKFFEYNYEDGNLNARPLTLEEVEKMLPDIRVITISEFSKNTNSLKIKKAKSNYKILIFNGYEFSSGNAKYTTYPISGLITVTKKGMIQFSKPGVNTQQSPWYILLLR